MACVCEVFPKTCDAHDIDHDKVVASLYHLGITLLFPGGGKGSHNGSLCVRLASTSNPFMDGHCTLSQAVHALWPVRQWMHDLPPPTISTLPQVTATWRQFRDIPAQPIFVTDGAWYSDHSCGGAIAIGAEDSNQVLVYPVHVPIALDNPYIVGQYNGWVLLEALALHGMLFSPCR